MFFKKSNPEPAAPPAPQAQPSPAPANGANSSASQAATAPTAPELPAEEAKRRAGIAKQAAAAFGEIVTLFMNAPTEKGRPISDLEWMVMPAVATGQYVLADAQSKQTGAVMPVGAVLWAFVSPEIDRALSNELDKSPKLKPQDWRSGDIPWIIMALGDQKVLGGLMQNLAKTVFKDKPVKIRARGKDGKVVVGRLEPGSTTLKF